MYEEQSAHLAEYIDRLNELAGCLNIDDKQRRIGELETEMGRTGFWNDPESAQKVTNVTPTTTHP